MYYSKKLNKSSSNIFDVFKIFYYASRIIGTAPFTIKVESNNNIVMKSTLIDHLIFAIFNISFGLVFYIWAAGKLMTNLFVTSSDVTNYGNQLLIPSSIFFALINNLINFVLKKKTIEIITDLIAVDSNMKILNLRVDYKAQTKMVNQYLFLCVFIFIVIASSSAVIYYMVSNNILLDLSVYTLLMLNNVFYVNLISQFVLCLLSVYERFRELNYGLEQIFKQYEKHNYSDDVRRVASIHDCLIEIVQKINFRFSVWIMFSLAFIFVFFTVSTFSIVRSIIVFETKTFLFRLLSFIWCLYYLSFLVMAIGVGSMTTRMVRMVMRQGRKFNRK